MQVDINKVLALFERIRAQFPALDCHIEKDHPELDLNMNIKQQQGLAFDVNINLQGDELHLCAGNFWCEWFPCTDKYRSEQFYENVCGLIAGRYRILEHYRRNKPVKAELQKPNKADWETVGVWATWSIPIPLKTTKRIMQNV